LPSCINHIRKLNIKKKEEGKNMKITNGFEEVEKNLEVIKSKTFHNYLFKDPIIKN
jgi:hypothetical protein